MDQSSPERLAMIDWYQLITNKCVSTPVGAAPRCMHCETDTGTTQYSTYLRLPAAAAAAECYVAVLALLFSASLRHEAWYCTRCCAVYFSISLTNK